MWDLFEFSAENFMHLRYVELKNIGRMNIFTGKNGQGKTSAVNALAYALGGKPWSPEEPTRKGAKGHKVHLGLRNGERGTYYLERTQNGLKIEPAPGCKAWNTPQAMLNDIFDEFALDPIEFIRLGKNAEGRREQVKILRNAITLSVDLEKLDAETDVDFKKRREINREVERLKAEIASVTVQPGLPNDPIDIGAIQARIQEANQHNQGVIRLIEERQRLSEVLAAAEAAQARNGLLIEHQHTTIERLTADLEQLKPGLSLAAAIRDELEDLKDQAGRLPELKGLASRLRDVIAEARARALAYIPEAGQAQNAAALDLDQARKTLQAAENQTAALAQAVADARLALEAAAKPAMVDVSALTEELNQAQLVNRQIERRIRVEGLVKEREAQESAAAALTRAMDRRAEQKRTAIADAKMPVEGLTFNAEAGKEEILFEGVPISQLGEAQQLKITISIALARKPGLRLIRIPHGEALDEDSLAELAQMAKDMNFIVWMARVDSSGKLGIYLEDGEVKAINEEPKTKGDLPSEKTLKN
jgi:DNA repair exonuclease SbcCD ATPase subunit